MVKLIFALFLILTPSIGKTAVFFTDGFETGDLSHVDSASGAKWMGSNRAAVSADISHSGTKSLKFSFVGSSDLSVDAAAEQWFTLGSQRQGVYLRYYIYFPANYTIRDAPSSDNTKLLRLWGDDYNNPNKIGMSISTDMTPYFEAAIDGYPQYLSCAGFTGPVPDQGGSWTIGPAHLGRWVCLEFYLHLDTGIGDGVLQMYVDGVLVKDSRGLSFAGAPCSPGYLLNGYLMGWSNSGFSVDTAVYIDDVVFSDSYIGLGEPTADVCDSAHLNLCTTSETCTTAGGHYCNGVCQSAECTVPSTGGAFLRFLSGGKLVKVQ